MVNPNLDSNLAHGGVGLGQIVVNVGSEGMQGDPPQHELFHSGNFRPRDPSLDDDLYSLSSTLHGPLGRLTHCAAVCYPAFQLVRDVSADQVGIDFRLLYFNDVQLYPPPCDSLQLGAKVLDPFPVPANQNSWAGGVYVDYAVLSAAVDLHPGDAGVGEILVFLADALS